MTLHEFWLKYYGKGVKVRVIDTDNIEYVGEIDSFTQALDNEENERSIAVMTNEKERMGVELFESEIKSIKVIQP